MADESIRRAYWRANLKLVGVLLALWFVVSFGFGILLAESLNEIRLGGFKLGFWFAQQGAIYGFLLIIIAYIVGARRIERRFGLGDD